MQVRFVLLSRSGKERVIARPLPLLVGRDEEAGLRLPRDSVSRRHCEFLSRDGGVVVRDLGSTNGTLLGTRPIEPHRDVPVAAGTVISVGGIKMRIDYDTPRTGPPPTPPALPGAADTRPDESQTVFTPDADDLLVVEEPPAAEPAPVADARLAEAYVPDADEALAAADAAAAEGAALAELEVAEEPEDAGDFGFLAAEPAAAVPADEWPDVAPPAPPDDEDLDDFFKSLS